MKYLGPGQLSGTFDSECGATRQVLDRVGDKWSVLIVVALGGGALRHAELSRALAGISQRVLTATLRGLERDGLVTRTVLPTKPIGVSYSLTELGRSLLVPVSALALWAQAHRPEVLHARAAFDGARSDVDA